MLQGLELADRLPELRPNLEVFDRLVEYRLRAANTIAGYAKRRVPLEHRRIDIDWQDWRLVKNERREASGPVHGRRRLDRQTGRAARDERIASIPHADQEQSRGAAIKHMLGCAREWVAGQRRSRRVGRE